MAESTKKSGSGWVWFVLGFVALAVIGGVVSGTKRQGAGEAERASEPAAAPAATWNESVDSTGKKQRWMPLTFEACGAVRANTIAELNVSPRRVIEIVNTGMLTVTRLCLSDGSSLLITCSAPDERMVVVEAPHGADVGCPG